MTVHVNRINSRANASYKKFKNLARGSAEYKNEGLIWIEGLHLCGAALASDRVAACLITSESFRDESLSSWGDAWRGLSRYVLSDDLMRELIGLEMSTAPRQSVAMLLNAPQAEGIQAHAPTVVLDRLQDPGNVGSILRCAAAFGYTQILCLQGTVSVWAPKVVRAGMGAHFALNLIEGVAVHELERLRVPIFLTSSHTGEYLHTAALRWPCAWVLGHEGQGVADDMLRLPHSAVRIAQPGGQESLNVAAAAAICLHASGIAAD
jgi:RNA methyltransferase, TrmH family